MTGQMNPTIAANAQSLAPGSKVELFELDLNPLGLPAADLPPGGKLYFSPSSIGETQITFRGQTYTSVPIEASGFEISGRGQLPQPLLRIANINNMAGTLAAAYEDLVGAVLKRTVTFAQYLDGQPMADVDAIFPPTIWEINQKTKQNKLYIEWKLVSFLDREGEELPKRKVWKHTCLWPYRLWNPDTGQFDYSQVQGCSYTGSNYFDSEGNPVANPEQDQCGLRIKDCKLRFGDRAVLPFGGFIGVNNR